MTTPTLAAGRAVICDDDALIRSVIRQVLHDSSVAVVGEADSPEDALVAIQDGAADILVLDLALRGGSGEHLLRQVHAIEPDVHVVVYSAYAADPTQLLETGATAVIDKPEFARLQCAIDDIVRDLGVPVERRHRSTRDPANHPGPTAVSLSGFEPWDSLLAATADLHAGDAILCVDLVPDPRMRDVWDSVFATDHRIALGRAIASARRSPDRVSISPTGRPVVLLVGGQPEASAAVFARLGEQWRREVDAGAPVGAFGLIRTSDQPLERLVTIEASVVLDRSTPLRMV